MVNTLMQLGGIGEVSSRCVTPADVALVSLAELSTAGPSVEELVEVLTLRAGYNTTLVLLSTTLLGIAAGIVGVFALLRKRSLMADTLSHATLPGIALAFIAATMLGMQGRSLPVLLGGATVTGVIGVICVQWLLRQTRLSEDTAMGLVLSVFFGAGAVLLSVIQTMSTGNAGGINHFIYGQTAAMNNRDLLLMSAIALAAVIAAALLLKEFALVCFDQAFAEVDGWAVAWIDLLMMALIVVVTVAGLQAVGLILVVAMLIIPAVAARLWTDRLWLLVLLAGALGGLSGYLGSTTSALLPRKPAGAVIVLVAGAVFVVSMLVAPRRGVLAVMGRRLRLRLDIATDHLVEAAYLSLNGEGKNEDLGDRREIKLDQAALDRIKRERAWGPGLAMLVSLRLRQLGLGRFSQGAFYASAKGLSRGRVVCRNHRLWEQYLVSYADIAPNHLDWAVDQVEHVLSRELVLELEQALAKRGIDVGGAV